MLKLSRSRVRKKVVETTTSEIVPPTLTTAISSLERGSEVLSILGSLQVFPKEFQSKTRDVVVSLRDLISDVKKQVSNKPSLADVGVFLDSLLKNYLASKVTTEQASLITNALKLVVEGEKKEKAPLQESITEKTDEPKPENVIDSLSDEKSAIAVLEVYAFCDSIPEKFDEQKIGEVLRDSGSKFRDILKSLGLSPREATSLVDYFTKFDKKIVRLLVLVASYQFSEGGDKPMIADEIKKVANLLTRQIIVDSFNRLDVATLSALHTIIVVLDSILMWNIAEEIAQKIKKEMYNFHGAISKLKAWALSLPPNTQIKIYAIIDRLYNTAQGILDIESSYTREDAESLAFRILGEQTLLKLRREVSKREDLRKNVQHCMEGNYFDINKAVKAYSSCLTRVLIQQKMDESLPLMVFADVVFEKMGELFKGQKAEPLNFLKGVFLEKKYW